MSKISNYPRKSFKTATDIAESVDKLGGKCSYELLAQSLNLKISGSFQDSVNAAIKHGLILKNKDNLELTALYTDVKLSYTPEEKNQHLQKSFLMVNVYEDMLKRFDGKEIPIHILDKMLMKEFSVSESIAKSVGTNLIKGAKSVGLIVNDKVVLGGITIERANDLEKESNNHELNTKNKSQQKDKIPAIITEKIAESKSNDPKLNIEGLGKNVSLNINISLSVPETTNEEVYNKFFEAMKKHLLS